MSKETFHEILNRLLTSANYQSQDEVNFDLGALNEEYLALEKANNWLRNNQELLRGWLHEAEIERDYYKNTSKTRGATNEI